jgi:hypothetical protein
MWSPATRAFRECDYNPFEGPPEPPEGVRQLHRIAQQALEQLALMRPEDLRYSRALDGLEWRHAWPYDHYGKPGAEQPPPAASANGRPNGCTCPPVQSPGELHREGCPFTKGHFLPDGRIVLKPRPGSVPYDEMITRRIGGETTDQIFQRAHETQDQPTKGAEASANE